MMIASLLIPNCNSILMASKAASSSASVVLGESRKKVTGVIWVSVSYPYMDRGSFGVPRIYHQSKLVSKME